jgi:hypothetical protein
LLIIFFHDKHWYRSEPLFSVEEEDEDEELDNEEGQRASSPTPSQETVTSVPPATTQGKAEYEFLLFNYLLRFVHREGKIGEFSRAGLLFLMDVAMSPGEQSQRSEVTESSSDIDLPSDPIVDAALALAEYILDGDFSEVLGAGLGAVYSLLPSKLEFSLKTEETAKGNAMTIGATGPLSPEEKEKLDLEKERSRAIGMENANSTDFRQRLDHFLKVLEFLQDVLRRNSNTDGVDASALVGTAIVQSILDAVRRVFLENVLYPSILECSDLDGSAVAVMSYIEIMLRILHEGPLSDLLINFLINEENDDPRPSVRPQALLNLTKASDHPPPRSSGAVAKSKRRKSSAMTLLEMEAPDTRKTTEYFTTSRFTLKDILMSNLRSGTQVTVTTALQLLQTLVLRFPQLSIERILIVSLDPLATSFPLPGLLTTKMFEHNDDEDEDDETFRYPVAEGKASPSHHYDLPIFSQPQITYYTHEREMNLYMNLISRVDPSHSGDLFSTGYEYYLHDAILSIQTLPAFQISLNLDEDLARRRQFKHRLNINDPILSCILDSLRSFFSNTPDLNIALTGFLANLALHPDRSLAGWLTFALGDAQSESPRMMDCTYASDGDDKSVDFKIEENLVYETNILPAAPVDESSRPVVHTIYHGLVNQLEHYRQVVDDFDKYLLERRQGLLFSENLTDALTLALDVSSQGAPQPSASSSPAPQTPTKPKPKTKTTSSFVSFLTPRRTKPAVQTTVHDSTSPPKDTSTKDNSISASPFGSHYRQTSAIKVESFSAPVPSTGLWNHLKTPNWNVEEEDVFGSAWSERTTSSDSQGHISQTQNDQSMDADEQQKTITLSQLLDNVVILEENIKELVAIVHARRSLGIDSIRYL